MKGIRWIFLWMLLAGIATAHEAVVVEIQSENRIVVQQDGRRFPVRLAGIASFATAGARQAVVPWQMREAFSRKAQERLHRMIPIGSVIHYAVIDDGGRGAPFVWLYDREVNYRLVCEGYALVDSSDPYLPGQLEIRLRMAMNYAHSKGLGFWRSPKAMVAMQVKAWYYRDKSVVIRHVKINNPPTYQKKTKSGRNQQMPLRRSG